VDGNLKAQGANAAYGLRPTASRADPSAPSKVVVPPGCPAGARARPAAAAPDLPTARCWKPRTHRAAWPGGGVAHQARVAIHHLGHPRRHHLKEAVVEIVVQRHVQRQRMLRNQRRSVLGLPGGSVFVSPLVQFSIPPDTRVCREWAELGLSAPPGVAAEPVTRAAECVKRPAARGSARLEPRNVTASTPEPSRAPRLRRGPALLGG